MFGWICAWLLGTAVAGDLPLRVLDEQRWTDIDQRATSTARVGGLTMLASTGVALVGGSLLAVGIDRDEAGVSTLGGLGVISGVTGMVVGPPILLGGAMRANRSLRSRGVMVSTVPGALGWTCYGLILFSPLAGDGAVVVLPALYAGSIALGYVQLGLNARHRTEARLQPVATSRLRLSLAPAPSGVALTGTF